MRSYFSCLLDRSSVSIILIVFASILSGCGSPKNAEVTLQAPLQVNNGEEFVIVATFKNSASKTQTLVSLDIGDEYLAGIAIYKTDPDHKEATHIPLDNTMSYVFRLPVNPGAEIRLLLYAKAVKPGDHNSEIDFCINSDLSFLSKTIRTIVK